MPGNFFVQLRGLLLPASVAHGFVLGSVCQDLGPVKGEMAKLHQPGFLAKAEHLDKKTGKSLEMKFTESSNGIMVWMPVRGEHPERDRMIGSLLDLAGRRHPQCIGVEKKTYHHPWIVGRLPPPFRFIGSVNLSQIKLLHHIHDEIHKIILG